MLLDFEDRMSDTAWRHHQRQGRTSTEDGTTIGSWLWVVILGPGEGKYRNLGVRIPEFQSQVVESRSGMQSFQQDLATLNPHSNAYLPSLNA